MRWLSTSLCLLTVPGAILGAFVVDAFFGTLDRYPYMICAGLGVVVVAAAWAWVLHRGRVGPRSMAVLCLATPLLPLLCISLGIGANAWLDRSPPVGHEARVLGYETRAKGPGVCAVESWRGSGEEALSDPNLVRRLPLSGCKPGSSLRVTTRAGAFGWEWVENVE
jgi:hypothetical protein